MLIYSECYVYLCSECYKCLYVVNVISVYNYVVNDIRHKGLDN